MTTTSIRDWTLSVKHPEARIRMLVEGVQTHCRRVSEDACDVMRRRTFLSP